mmetsp:Transcript_2449/g.5807  ORF Transcript_2449/g.5807 Transcript_2449/m.5807 type:complete len:399 (+) Transcript_2449:198-1394(+)
MSDSVMKSLSPAMSLNDLTISSSVSLSRERLSMNPTNSSKFTWPSLSPSTSEKMRLTSSSLASTPSDCSTPPNSRVLREPFFSRSKNSKLSRNSCSCASLMTLPFFLRISFCSSVLEACSVSCRRAHPTRSWSVDRLVWRLSVMFLSTTLVCTLSTAASFALPSLLTSWSRASSAASWSSSSPDRLATKSFVLAMYASRSLAAPAYSTRTSSLVTWRWCSASSSPLRASSCSHASSQRDRMSPMAGDSSPLREAAMSDRRPSTPACSPLPAMNLENLSSAACDSSVEFTFTGELTSSLAPSSHSPSPPATVAYSMSLFWKASLAAHSLSSAAARSFMTLSSWCAASALPTYELYWSTLLASTGRLRVVCRLPATPMALAAASMPATPSNCVFTSAPSW